MPSASLQGLANTLSRLAPVHLLGRVSGVGAGVIHVTGLTGEARLGDRLRIGMGDGTLVAEVVQMTEGHLVALPEGPAEGIALGARATLAGPARIAPGDHWLGRIVDPTGAPLDGRPLMAGALPRPLRAPAPPAAQRRALGPRLSTGMAVTNTFLPLVRGQRMGLFAGSGVGKSTLLGRMAEHTQADVVVIALIGERGRELRHFVEEVIGERGMSRAVIVAATSDQSALLRRQCAWTAMAVAEHFRDTGRNVLLLADSITRFAEAHREVEVAAGHAPVLRGHPPTTAHEIMSLCERAGPGTGDQGDITAIFSVLVAGSDMEEPVADILRGVLDGHIVLDRAIAERGRYPAIDLLRSTSRSLPGAATPDENRLLTLARKILSDHDSNAMMIRAGLYSQGSDPAIDLALQVWPELDAFLAREDPHDCNHSFQQLELLLRRAGAITRPDAPHTVTDAA